MDTSNWLGDTRRIMVGGKPYNSFFMYLFIYSCIYLNIYSFSFILTNDGNVYVCDKNKSGILGLGDSRMKIKPTCSSCFGNIKIINIDFHENTAKVMKVKFSVGVMCKTYSDMSNY